VKPSYGLSDEAIARMLQDANARAADDMRARALREQQVEAEQLLEAVGNALTQDGEALLSPPQRAAIETGIRQLTAALSAADLPALKRAVSQLNEATVSFAQARMDQSVARALGGKKLSDLEN